MQPRLTSIISDSVYFLILIITYWKAITKVSKHFPIDSNDRDGAQMIHFGHFSTRSTTHLFKLIQRLYDRNIARIKNEQLQRIYTYSFQANTFEGEERSVSPLSTLLAKPVQRSSKSKVPEVNRYSYFTFFVAVINCRTEATLANFILLEILRIQAYEHKS